MDDIICDYKYHIMPILVISNASEAIEYYKKLFDAIEVRRTEQFGLIIHAEILIGYSILMIADEIQGINYKSAQTIGDTPVILYIYVDDIDETFTRAKQLGATILYKPADKSYGDRMGSIMDPFGFKWNIAKKINNQVERSVSCTSTSEKQQHIWDIMAITAIKLYKRKFISYKKKYEKLKQLYENDWQ